MEIKKYIWPFCIVVVSLECLYFLPGQISDVFVKNLWGNPAEVTNRGLGEVYTTIEGRYEIWKQLGHIQVCNKLIRYGCLNWRIKGLKIIGNQDDSKALIYFELFNKADLGKDSFINGNRFKFFGDLDIRVSTSKDRVPKFAVLWHRFEADLYDDINLKYAFPEEQKIFKELEKNPTIVINGIDYTHKKLN